MFIDVLIQPVGKTDKLPLDRFAGGKLIDRIRRESLSSVL